HRVDTGVGVAVCGDSIARGDAALGDLDLRLVRDVAEHTAECAATEKRPLRDFEDLDALEVGRIDIQIAAGQLSRLLVEVNGDRRKRAGGAAALIPTSADAQAAHEDLTLRRALAGLGDVGQILDELIERL